MIACARKACGYLFKADFNDDPPRDEDYRRWRCPNCLGPLKAVDVDIKNYDGEP